MEKPAYTYTTYIASTLEKVWEGITQEEFTRQYWNAELKTDWKTGSPIEMMYKGELHVKGEVLVYEPFTKLSYTWKKVSNPEMAKDPASRATFELEQVGPNIKLTLVHDQFEPGSKMYDGVRVGWPMVLSGLKTLLETGKALPELV